MDKKVGIFSSKTQKIIYPNEQRNQSIISKPCVLKTKGTDNKRTFLWEKNYSPK